MALLLSNDDVAAVLRMPEAIAAIDEAYAELAAGLAVNRPRTHTHLATRASGVFYRFKSMEGGLSGSSVYALRLASDVVDFPVEMGAQRQRKLPAAQGKWVGLNLLFDAQTGELLAIMPDGFIQRTRVGATSGIAARYLSRQETAVVGLIGSGWQAGSQLLAFAAVRPVREVRVYSPHAGNRETFARQMSEELNIDVRPVASAEAAVNGADLVAAATNAIVPVLSAGWLRPGMHVTAVQPYEWGPDIFSRCDVVVVHSNDPAPDYVPAGIDRSGLHSIAGDHEALARFPALLDLVAARAEGRTGADQVTGFMNNMGAGVQFAACGLLAYRLARARGLGTEIPADWFVQSIHT